MVVILQCCNPAVKIAQISVLIGRSMLINHVLMKRSSSFCRGSSISPVKLSTFSTFSHFLRSRMSLCNPNSTQIRLLNQDNRRGSSRAKDRKEAAYYVVAGALICLSLTYLAVPLYRIYCQTTGKGGQAVVDKKEEKISEMKPNKKRKINVHFLADAAAKLHWNFEPTQDSVTVSPGETALAFFTARNPLKEPMTGISTYNVVPFEAGEYLNKIQCFCFEEQILNPLEEVDLPVFFYIDPEYAKDGRLENVDDIYLSYTFFEAKKKLNLPFIEKLAA